ncbi:hypothetical protein [Rubritalea tangerina]|uniref:hypothetical protein n=1 Tax=Rubritalea tangerina TaxID=430798 RepID=UPI0036125B71
MPHRACGSPFVQFARFVVKGSASMAISSDLSFEPFVTLAVQMFHLPSLILYGLPLTRGLI